MALAFTLADPWFIVPRVHCEVQRVITGHLYPWSRAVWCSNANHRIGFHGMTRRTSQIDNDSPHHTIPTRKGSLPTVDDSCGPVEQLTHVTRSPLHCCVHGVVTELIIWSARVTFERNDRLACRIRPQDTCCHQCPLSADGRWAHRISREINGPLAWPFSAVTNCDKWIKLKMVSLSVKLYYFYHY